MNIKFEDKFEKILSYLLKYRHTTYKDLANHMNVSTKTARKYINMLQEMIGSETDVLILVKPGLGIELKGDPSDIFTAIQSKSLGKINSIEDRIMYVYSRFLNTNEFIRIQDLADELFVSRATMENTVREIRTKLKKEGVSLISSHQGLKIDASEALKRHLMSDVIHYYWGGVTAISSQKEKVKLGVKVIGNTNDLIDSNVLDDVADVLNEFIEKTNLEVTEYEYQTLSIHLAIALERIKQDFYVDKEIDFNDTPSKNTKIFIELIEQKFNIKMPNFEREYVDVHISVIEKNSLNDVKAEKLQVLDYSDKLKKILYFKLINFTPDAELINSLVVHLNAAIKRLKLGVSIHNPYTSEIKINFSGAFALSYELAQLIATEFGITMNDDEIAFITLHVQSFLDREGHTPRDVILVCSSGYGTSKLLEQRIKKRFKSELNIKKIMGIRDLQKSSIKNELIISTLPISNIKNTVIVVSPLMTTADAEKIESYIKRRETDSKEIFMRFIQRDCCFISNSFGETQQEVLENITNKLIENNYADNGIYQSAIKREQMSTTAMGSFAIPHAEIKYVKQPIISIYINKNGIDWQGEKVQLVFFFALNEQVKDLINQVYEFFNEVISSNYIIKRLTNCTNFEEIEIVLGDVLNGVHK
ncbi:BglG family transcription antiterminator [Vagococcus vulneris]|uniref:Transcriptional antiterminator n=1 Tax=Vagococcus vulneris TaxID=1977869 RepID=A0A429ZYU8_9ENTE|nr:BglG family transcription antiterminator [Vagococcus vulneris]RST99167.1 transcriptional antiterminator [Vagococcus vulneris]